MQKDHRSLNKIFGLTAFFSAFILYFMTMPPTTSFWDCAERIACSYMLQIPHPPGAPFYLILGRMFSMFVPVEYVAYSINMMSTLASSISITLLYLIIIRLIREFKGHPDSYDNYDKLALYAGGLIGALTFAVSDSFWFTAVEAETYALSLCFTSLAVWLSLKWSEQADRPDSERWIILIAYVFGLAFGVHLLSLLSIFTVALIIYFRKFEFSVKGFLIAGILAVGAFFLIFPFTIIQLPTIAGSMTTFTGGLLGPSTFALFILSAIVGGLYYSHKKKLKLLNIVILAYTCILIGYSSYTLIYVRSMAQPPIDQNSPDNVDDFISYLKREQYGATPLLTGASFNNVIGDIDRENEKLFPRRHSREGRHLAKYAEYSSDWSFFWNYQLGHMYFRYFAWNFIGRDADTQDADWISGFRDSINSDNPGHNRLFYLPFLLGLIGMLYHFQRDWKRGMAVMALFLATGVAIVIFLNQYPFQPRERDYSYTGSFFAFSIWIGMGASAIIFLLKDLFKNKIGGAYTTAALIFVSVPLWMGFQNYDDHDRSLQYVAPDYAYNLLNSVAPYAIIFTNGDNDTFPLWYLQDVEGVRRDVRVVNLSLLNTTWYILQMKNKYNYDAPPVPISLTDEQVSRIEDKFRFERPGDFYQPREQVIPVNKNMLSYVFEDSSRITEGSPPLTSGLPYGSDMSFEIPVELLDDEVRWFYQGNSLGADRQGNELFYTRIQDDMVMDILRTNEWVRPVYFAITVSQDGQLNMQSYFRLEGKAFRVVPMRQDQPFGSIDPVIHGERLRNFKFREIDNENAYFDENIRRMVDNYRTIITRQATAWMELNEPDSARYWMRWGEDKIPFTTIQGDMTSVVSYAYRYAQLEDFERATDLSEKGIDRLVKTLTHNISRIDRVDDRIEQLQVEISRNRTNLSKRQSLEAQLRNVMGSRENLVSEISFDSSRFMIIQRIFYMADLDDRAMDISILVNDLTSGRVPFPTNREDNRRQVQRIYGD
jgi:MFS family permease